MKLDNAKLFSQQLHQYFLLSVIFAFPDDCKRHVTVAMHMPSKRIWFQLHYRAAFYSSRSNPGGSSSFDKSGVKQTHLWGTQERPHLQFSAYLIIYGQRNDWLTLSSWLHVFLRPLKQPALLCKTWSDLFKTVSLIVDMGRGVGAVLCGSEETLFHSNFMEGKQSPERALTVSEDKQNYQDSELFCDSSMSLSTRTVPEVD